MIKILFVCLGNICRSPMAEFVFRDMTRQAGCENQFQIESAATSAWEIGNPVYPPVQDILRSYGISCEGKTARQMTQEDYAKFDMLIGMDFSNLEDMRKICGGDPEYKMHLLMDFTDRPGNVADPYFTGDFDAAWRDVTEGCGELLYQLREKQRRESKAEFVLL